MKAANTIAVVLFVAMFVFLMITMPEVMLTLLGCWAIMDIVAALLIRHWLTTDQAIKMYGRTRVYNSTATRI